MAINAATETLLSLADAARRCPRGRNGARVSPSTVLRWILNGVKPIAGGERIRLGGARLGGRWITSVEAIQRFHNAQTPDLDATPDGSAQAALDQRRQRTASAREQAAANLEKQLERMGLRSRL
jgi:hypothetical protein